MTTLAEMVTSITREIRRYDADWDARIRAEITRAIRFYQRERFWFNETRLITFNTVALQEFYTGDDQADIPNLLAIDYVTLTENTNVYDLCFADPRNHDTNDLNIAPNRPVEYSYFQSQIRFWPIPNNIYPIRINSLIRRAAPADDAEEDNPWMVDAEELIRSRAKRNLFLHAMGDDEQAASMKAAEDEALRSLRAETSRRTNVHTFMPAEVY
jgi:hypothetical protein